MALLEPVDLNQVQKDLEGFVGVTKAKLAKLKEMHEIAKSMGEVDPEFERLIKTVESMIDAGVKSMPTPKTPTKE